MVLSRGTVCHRRLRDDRIKYRVKRKDASWVTFLPLTPCSRHSRRMTSKFQRLLMLAALVGGISARSTANLLARTSTDTCGNLDGELSAPDLGVTVNFGVIGRQTHFSFIVCSNDQVLYGR